MSTFYGPKKTCRHLVPKKRAKNKKKIVGQKRIPFSINLLFYFTIHVSGTKDFFSFFDARLLDFFFFNFFFEIDLISAALELVTPRFKISLGKKNFVCKHFNKIPIIMNGPVTRNGTFGCCEWASCCVLLATHA